jgi:hypothetical protein
MRPKVRELISEHSGDAQLITLNSRGDTARFLAGTQA